MCCEHRANQRLAIRQMFAKVICSLLPFCLPQTTRNAIERHVKRQNAKHRQSLLSCLIREYFCRIRLQPQPQPQPQCQSLSRRALCLQHLPLLVELCTALIEARGLDSIGIYRVPGNATAIALIQEEFAQVRAASVLSPHLLTRISQTPRHSLALRTSHTFRFVYVLRRSTVIVFCLLSTLYNTRLPRGLLAPALALALRDLHYDST